MTITDREKVLMECLAHIWCQNEVILVFLIDIIYTESLSCGVCKSSYNVAVYYFLFLVFVKSLYFEWVLRCVFDPVVVIYPLLRKIHVLA